MNHLRFLLALSAALGGCAVTPNLLDTTSPTVTLTVYFQKASHASDIDSIDQVVNGLDVNKCIYVASPFLVAVLATTPGGVSKISIAASYNNSLNVLTANTKATPPPGSPMQGDPIFGTYPNPGSPFGANASGVSLTYYDVDTQTGGPVYNLANLEAAYRFVPGQVPYSALLVEAWNSNFGHSHIGGYYVRLAGTGANEQPGMPCEIPH
jgi:hypothetical protein